MRYPLCGKRLKFFHGMVRGKLEKGPDEVEAFVVGQVGGGLLFERLTVEVLQAKMCQWDLS